MIKKIFFATLLAVMAHSSMAQKCNRNAPIDADYLEPYEFCDDNFQNKKIPQFKDYPSDKTIDFKEILPSKILGSDNEQNSAWLEAIKHVYKNDSINFAGHYLFVWRGGCGTECHRALIVDLQTGKIYTPIELDLVLANVNSLPKSLCQKLDVNCNEDTFSFKKDSNLIVIIGQLGEGTNKRGIYHMKWENNQLKLISKVEKIPDFLKKKK